MKKPKSTIGLLAHKNEQDFGIKIVKNQSHHHHHHQSHLIQVRLSVKQLMVPSMRPMMVH
jgi:hypothetical protein